MAQLFSLGIMQNPPSTFKPTNIFQVMVLAVAFLLEGCGQPPDTDITASPTYNFSSFAGTVWKTKVKTALSEIELYTGKRIICLDAPDVFDPADPHYAPVPGAKIVSMLPVGTRIHIERLMKDNGIGCQYWVIATVEDGTTSQTNIYIGRHFLANNQFIPTGPTSSTNWSVNPDILEKP